MMKESWKSVGLGGILIVLLTLVAYVPAMRGGFIWDDDDHLTKNPAMAVSNGLCQIWSSLAVSRYYPLTLTSFWVQRRLWGLNPLPYHAVNIALHAANAVLAFLLLRRLRVPWAWAAAALWALHPVCVESVAWVTELKNTQSALFFFLALVCYLRFEEQPSYGRYALTLICGAAAMLSKPSTVVLPAVLLLIVWWRRGRCRWNDSLRMAPFFAFSLGMSVLTIVEQQRHITAGGREAALSGLERLLLPGKIVWFYLGKLLWPADLMFIYPRWKLDPTSLLNWVPLIAAAVTAGTLWGLHRLPRAQACLLGLGYFGLLLLPVSGLFDIFFFRYSFVSDHFQYLACIGPIALAASAGAAVCRRAGQWGQRLGMLAVAAVLTMLGVSTWRQGLTYKDPETLWRDTLAKNPDAWMAHTNLGKALFDLGKVPEAIAEFVAALRIKPDYAEAHYDWGVALASQDRISEAIAEYAAALRIKPDYAEAHNNLGIVLAGQGRVSEAITEYRASLRIKPDNVEAHNNLGVALAGQGRVAEAITEFTAALRIKSDNVEARNNLGVALAGQGRVAEAITEYAVALRIKPDYAEAHYNLGNAMASQGRIAEAMAEYRETLRLRPDWPPVLGGLAWILATSSNESVRNGGEAVQLAERLCAVSGCQEADGLDVLAAACAEAGRFNDAVRVAQEAVELASAAGQQELAGQIQERLKLYQGGRPFREESVLTSPRL
jgi:tetratricopeptide (TPR) repeat protein